MELTKFKLSLLNSVGAYTMFYYYAPLLNVGMLESAVFLGATQALAMSTQCFGQVQEAEHDALMARTKNRPMVLKKFTNMQGCMIGTGLTVASFAAYQMFVPYTFIISSTVWFSYLAIYLPMNRRSSNNTLVGAVVGALPPFIGTFAQTGMLFDLPTMLLASYIFSW
jgi:protoheme IX farnesyltransferase